MAKLLIIDDDLTEHKLYFAYIEGFTKVRTFTPIIVENGEEAVAEYLLNRDIDIVVLDTSLPPSNEKGWQIYDRLRQEGYTGPVIATSAGPMVQEWKDRKVPFFDKNSSLNDLEDVLNKLLNEAQKP